MTALTLTPDPVNAAVTVQVTGAPAGALTITRSDAAGWAYVRLTSGQAPIAGVLTVVDAEAALTGQIRYHVKDSAGDITSASVTLAAGPRPRLAAAVLPAFAASPDQIIEDETTRTVHTVHDVIGATDPLPVLAPARRPERVLTAYAASFDTAQELMAVATSSYILRYRCANPAMDAYLVVTEARLSPLELLQTGWAWAVTITARETSAPRSVLLGSVGWTFADVTADYPTYAALSSEFATFADMVIAP